MRLAFPFRFNFFSRVVAIVELVKYDRMRMILSDFNSEGSNIYEQEGAFIEGFIALKAATHELKYQSGIIY